MDQTNPTREPLVDKFGRTVSYIRLSVTDRCDFRCTYCMAEEMTFLPRSEVLSLEECLRLARVFVGLGVTKIRITGGEPLVRKNVLWLFQQLGKLEGLRELVLTTNGSQLERFAGPLMDAGVRRVNVSVDSLDPDKFRRITRVGDLGKVLRGVAAAKAAGFSSVKLNTVMINGVNDDEFVDLVQYAVDNELDIAFIEEMPLGDIGHSRAGTYYSTDDALARLGARFEMVSSPESTGGPARYWRIPGTRTKVGFISPHSHNFCGSCNRVRITCRGELYPCLGQNDAADLLPILRAGDDDAPVRQAIVDTMGIKPRGHDFNLFQDKPKVVRFMSVTGG
jgi:cyclic pyranopterin phosphate synthase